jgi:hypothetical protein
MASATVGSLPVPDLAAAVFLSLYAVVLTSGALGAGHGHGAVGASIGVLAMTLPAAWCRRAPVAAAGVMALGSVLNGVLFGSMVRCGAALPAVFIVAFFVAGRSERDDAALGLVFCATNVAAQAVYDPNLGAEEVVLLLPVLGFFFALGRIVRGRTAALVALRRRTAELRRQREQTARLTVMADRARVSEDLDRMLRERIGRIGAVAVVGRDALETDPATTLDALLSVERDGREVLRQMREIVGSLDHATPGERPPTLAELPVLLARRTSADTRLTVDGTPRRLPAGIELAGYRIAEHLLTAFADAPGAMIDVRLRFAAEAVELHVSGPPADGAELGAVLAVARERAALHSGTLGDHTAGGICHATARLPLISGHAYA